MRKPRVFAASIAAGKSRPAGAFKGNSANGPAITDSIKARSARLRAIGPATASVSQGRSVGQIGTKPGVGRSPKTPQNAAGVRIEPPRSLPSAKATIPDASAAAPPPVEPPAVSDKSQGLRVAPNNAFLVLAPAANSGTLVLPRTIASARRRRSTMTASCSGTKSARRREPKVVRMPAVGTISLIATGTPASGPGFVPAASLESSASASARACSAAKVQIALICGFNRSIASR